MREVKRFKPVINNKPYRPYAYCEENSEGIYVRIDDYEALKAERDALAAEVATSIQAVDYVLECYEAAQVEGLFSAIDSCGDENIKDIFRRRIIPIVPCLEPTPVTDAFLNSVRANAIDSAAEKAGEFASQCKVGSSTWHKWKSVVMFLVGESHTRRAGKDGE